MVSVVVSVFNTGKHLSRTINSLLAQTVDDFEVIIVDDGSTDGSETVCDEVAALSPIIRVFHKSNGGLSSARNCGIDHARGDYIIFPDPDDWVEPDYLEKLLCIREENRADLGICGYYTTVGTQDTAIDESGEPVIWDTAEATWHLVEDDIVRGFAWNKLYRMDVIENSGLRFDESLGMVQDLHFAFRYFQLCERIAYDPTPLYHYTLDSGGVTGYYHPLTARKLSAIDAFEKVAQLAHGTYPDVESHALGVLCSTSLHYLCIYYHYRMNDPALRDYLISRFVQYRHHMLSSDHFSTKLKVASRIAPVFPRFYYELNALNRRIKHLDD